MSAVPIITNDNQLKINFTQGHSGCMLGTLMSHLTNKWLCHLASAGTNSIENNSLVTSLDIMR